MTRIFLALSLSISSSLVAAQGLSETEVPPLEEVLAFEVPLENGMPRAWRGGPPETISLDRETVHSGRSAARIDRDAGSPQPFSALTISVPIDFEGTTVELRGFLRTQDVSGFAGFWMREDGPSGTLAFDSMQQRRIDGTREWAEYRILLPLAPAARQLFFGASLMGQGTVWADDIEILVDGRPLNETPRIVRAQTVLDTDREFADGSEVTVETLSPRQIENLAVLGRVWGFLKYHHPRIAAGELHWDYELFRILPVVLDAPNAVARNDALLAWGRRIGSPAPCAPCAVLPQDAHLASDVAWIRDAAALGSALSTYLESVHRNRHASGNQFYVAQAAQGAGNPIFDSELAYQSLVVPDAGYRLLALFRFWNMVEYWFPYRDVIGEAWLGVLNEFLPVFVAAGTRDDYALALMKLIARINDTHASLRGGDVLPPRGTCQIPVAIRFIDGLATVAGYSNAVKGRTSGLEIGDVILAMDSNSVDRLIDEWVPYYSASNSPTKLHNIARFLTRGPCDPAALRVLRGQDRLSMSVERIPVGEIDYTVLATHDLAGDTFQWLTDEVAYLKLSSIKQADVAGYIERARRARGLVIDIRNYPSEFVVFALGQHLVREPVEFVQFTVPDSSNPGAFRWTLRASHQPMAPHYDGKVAILVDETTISQAEYTAMALRATPNAVVIGSTTAGADGNVSALPLPGGFGSAFSGLGVFYPDGSPTQRVGIVPDIVVTPTVEGIRSGRDEVLERALREIAGSAATATIPE
jgi:C-terminal processing protease CtpA/Prc